MNEEVKNNQNLYQCKECGLHYKDKDTAEKCEAWCREHKTCNVEITKQAEESKKYDQSSFASSSAKATEDKLMEFEKRCEGYLNNWKRERADFLNYKKDEVERAETLVKYAKEDTILNILPILDNIYLSEKQLPEKLKKGLEGSKQSIEWTKGFLQIQNQIAEFLKKEGLEEIKTVGEKFNPETMEVIDEAIDNSQLTSDTVMEEVQKGYIMNGKVIRPAKVKVVK